MTNLNQMDVKKLINEPSAKMRSMLAGKIALDYASGNFNSSEADLAVDIFRILLKDIDKKVRLTMAEHLRNCTNVPHDVIIKLAQDEVDVASYVLEFSTVLSEEDLVAIAESTAEVMKLCAIARRDTVSERLADTLVTTGIESVLKDLFNNKGAVLSERSLTTSWDTISGNDALLSTLVVRGGLPLMVAEKLFYAVSDELKQHMAQHYKLDIFTVQESASEAREWETLGITPGSVDYDPNDDEQVEALVEHLHLSSRLTHSMIIRALCMGNLVFFEEGIAKLAGVPRINAHILMMDEGGMGFEAIYKTAAMPEGFFEAIKVLLRITLEETEYGKKAMRRMELRKRIIDRIYVAGYNRTVENMSYVLAIIGGKLAATAHVN